MHLHLGGLLRPWGFFGPDERSLWSLLGFARLELTLERAKVFKTLRDELGSNIATGLHDLAQRTDRVLQVFLPSCHIFAEVLLEIG